jgi:hypothetical protein
MRKSKILRLQQATELVAGFTPTHQQVFAWDYRFLSDITHKLGAGRKISKKQRDILDEKIEKGIPSLPTETPEQTILSEALEAIAGVAQFSWEHRVGGDMLVKLRKGWSISEKQQKLIDDIVKRAKDWKTLELPSDEMLQRVLLVRKLAKCYNGNYWYSHQKAASYIRIIDGNKFSEENLKNAEWAVRGQLKKWNKVLDKYPSGTMCRVQARTRTLAAACNVQIGAKVPGIVISEPRVERGGIMLDVLVAGVVESRYAQNVTSR